MSRMKTEGDGRRGGMRKEKEYKREKGLTGQGGEMCSVEVPRLWMNSWQRLRINLRCLLNCTTRVLLRELSRQPFSPLHQSQIVSEVEAGGVPLVLQHCRRS